MVAGAAATNIYSPSYTGYVILYFSCTCHHLYIIAIIKIYLLRDGMHTHARAAINDEERVHIIIQFHHSGNVNHIKHMFNILLCDYMRIDIRRIGSFTIVVLDKSFSRDQKRSLHFTKVNMLGTFRFRVVR